VLEFAKVTHSIVHCNSIYCLIYYLHCRGYDDKYYRLIQVIQGFAMVLVTSFDEMAWQ